MRRVQPGSCLAFPAFAAASSSCRHKLRTQADHASLPVRPTACASLTRVPPTLLPRGSSPWTTFLPLGLVLGIAMIKEGLEDYKRYRQDREVNSRSVQVRRAAGRQGHEYCCSRREAGGARGWRALPAASAVWQGRAAAGGSWKFSSALSANDNPCSCGTRCIMRQVFDSEEQRFVTKTWADVRVGDVITVFKVRGWDWGS